MHMCFKNRSTYFKKKNLTHDYFVLLKIYTARKSIHMCPFLNINYNKKVKIRKKGNLISCNTFLCKLCSLFTIIQFRFNCIICMSSA